MSTIKAPNFSDLEWLEHGFGMRDSVLPSGISTVKQIHSGIVLEAPAGGCEAGGCEVDAREGDALLSARSGLLIGVKTADCVPILLVDPVIRVVAAIHAGWRGTVENIAATAVKKLVTRWQSRPEHIRAAIGPSIGVCCYEVGADVGRRFEDWIPEMGTVEDHVHLDLRAVNELQLRAAGVECIWKSDECTYCAAQRFYSFRREREQAGRMVSFIGLQEGLR